MWCGSASTGPPGQQLRPEHEQSAHENKKPSGSADACLLPGLGGGDGLLAGEPGPPAGHDGVEALPLGLQGGCINQGLQAAPVQDDARLAVHPCQLVHVLPGALVQPLLRRGHPHRPESWLQNGEGLKRLQQAVLTFPWLLCALLGMFIGVIMLIDPRTAVTSILQARMGVQVRVSHECL